MTMIPELAKRLDVLVPDWADRCDPDELKMGLPNRCVLFNLRENKSEGYYDVAKRLGFFDIDSDEPQEKDEEGREVEVYFATRTDEWVAEILKRRGENGNAERQENLQEV